MEVIFLGTNGWYDTKTGNTICILIKAKNYNIILDAGNGIAKIDDYCKSKKDTYLFISHFHLDHIIGVHTLAKLRNIRRLHIIIPRGTRKTLNTIANSPYTVPLSKLPFPVKVSELKVKKTGLPFSVLAARLLHSTLTIGFRLEIEGKVITYCPDTGYCSNAVRLARDADILIAECANKGKGNPKWPHLNPESAARIAKEAGAKKLVLVHFSANIYKELKDRNAAQSKARRIFNNTFAAIDGMKIKL